MVLAQPENERQALRRIADEYRNRGYSVTVEPRVDEIPDFIKPYRPDLIAHGANETVVVEVKSQSIRSDDDFAHLSNVVNSRPGWRFELVIVPTTATTGAVGLAAPKLLIDTWIEADALIRRNLLEPGSLLAWVAAEGGLRHAVRATGLADQRDPRALARQAVSVGVITESELRLIDSMMLLRNRLVHGFASEIVDRQIVEKFLSFTQRLLEAGETASDTFEFPVIDAWVRAVLIEYTGFKIEDQVFDRDSVVVHAPDGSSYVLTMEQWTDVDPSERSARLRQNLIAWANQHLAHRAE